MNCEKIPLDQALDYVLANEGGFSDHPADRGGATRYGITKETASRWRGYPVSVAEMREFPIYEARKIYEAWYWKPIGCDKILDANIATAMFDIGIVRGTGVSALYAQQVCNHRGAKLVEDHQIGPKSVAAINSIPRGDFIRAFASRAESGFRSIVAANASQEVFLRGWLNRAKRLLTLA